MNITAELTGADVTVRNGNIIIAVIRCADSTSADDLSRRINTSVVEMSVYADRPEHVPPEQTGRPCPDCNPMGVFRYGDERCQVCNGKAFLPDNTVS